MSSIYLVLVLRILKPETFSAIWAISRLVNCATFLHLGIFGDNSLLSLFLHLLAKYEELYAFSYNPKQKEAERVKGWELIDLSEEYKRMGVPNTNWQLSDANRDYKVSMVMETCSVSHLFLLYHHHLTLVL